MKGKCSFRRLPGVLLVSVASTEIERPMLVTDCLPLVCCSLDSLVPTDSFVVLFSNLLSMRVVAVPSDDRVPLPTGPTPVPTPPRIVDVHTVAPVTAAFPRLGTENGWIVAIGAVADALVGKVDDDKADDVGSMVTMSLLWDLAMSRP